MRKGALQKIGATCTVVERVKQRKQSASNCFLASGDNDTRNTCLPAVKNVARPERRAAPRESVVPDRPSDQDVAPAQQRIKYIHVMRSNYPTQPAKMGFDEIITADVFQFCKTVINAGNTAISLYDTHSLTHSLARTDAQHIHTYQISCFVVLVQPFLFYASYYCSCKCNASL